MNSESSFLKRTWTRLGPLWRALVAIGLVAAIAGTVYSTLIEPKVKDVIAGPSRLEVTVLQPGEFTISGLAHSGAWIFPTKSPRPEDLPSSIIQAGSDEFNAWALEHGGVAAQTLALRLSVRAADESPVILHGLQVDVVKREKPLEGWFFYPEHACGGQPVRSVSVFLDEEPVVPRNDRGKPFDVTLRVTRADPEVYEIHATTSADYVEFRMTLLYDSETGIGEYEVNDGATFAVTSIRGDASAYRFPYFSEISDSAGGLERDASLDGAGLGC